MQVMRNRLVHMTGEHQARQERNGTFPWVIACLRASCAVHKSIPGYTAGSSDPILGRARLRDVG